MICPRWARFEFGSGTSLTKVVNWNIVTEGKIVEFGEDEAD